MDEGFSDGDREGPKAQGGSSPRIGDVARAAGVSTATVSRVLSRPDLVSARTRDSVLAAVAATGYRVNQAARNLRRRRTGGIVVLVPHLSNPFFSLILDGIARVASGAGLNVLVADTQEPKGADRRIAFYLDDNRADGLIVLDGSLPASVLSGRGRRPPLVFACEWMEGRPAVTIDNRQGAATAVGHLLALGHRRIGHVTGPPGNVLTVQRLAGVRAALAAAGLAADGRWFFEGDFTLSSGVAAARRFLALRDRPTAVFCASDAMACGFVSELDRAGVKVPRDVSVVGFDDIDIAAHFIPPLTTIHQPRAAIGEAAAGMLLGLMATEDGEGAAPGRVLPTELVVRASTAPPKARLTGQGAAGSPRQQKAPEP